MFHNLTLKKPHRHIEMLNIKSLYIEKITFFIVGYAKAKLLY